MFNVGVGIADSHGEQRGGKLGKKAFNLHEVFADFTRIYEPARQLVEDGEWVRPLKGAPLRCTLEGARYSRPGLIVTGEAAGSTYSFTGEGIGKALETGILAAEAVGEGRARATPEAEVRARVIEVATAHRLVTKYTSFVAVDKTPARPSDAQLKLAAVPTNLPEGWEYDKVFGELPQGATDSRYAMLTGLLMLLIALGMLLAPRRQRCA